VRSINIHTVSGGVRRNRKQPVYGIISGARIRYCKKRLPRYVAGWLSFVRVRFSSSSWAIDPICVSFRSFPLSADPFDSTPYRKLLFTTSDNVLAFLAILRRTWSLCFRGVWPPIVGYHCLIPLNQCFPTLFYITSFLNIQVSNLTHSPINSKKLIFIIGHLFKVKNKIREQLFKILILIFT